MNLHDISVSITVDKKNYVAQLQDVSKTTKTMGKQIETETKKTGAEVQSNLDKINMRKAYTSVNMFFRLFIGTTAILAVRRGFSEIISAATKGDQEFTNKVDNMKESWNNFLFTLGRPIVSPLSGLIADVTNLLNTLSGYKGHPGLAYDRPSGAVLPMNDKVYGQGGTPEQQAFAEFRLRAQAGQYYQGNLNMSQKYRFLPPASILDFGSRNIGANYMTPGRNAGQYGLGRKTGTSSLTPSFGSTAAIDEQMTAMEDRFRVFNYNMRSSFSDSIYGAITGMGVTWKSVIADMGRVGARFAADFAGELLEAQMRSGMVNFMSGNKYLSRYAPAMAFAVPGSPQVPIETREVDAMQKAAAFGVR